MWRYALSYPIFAVIFGLFDAVWLSTAFGRVYQPALGPLLAERLRLGAAALFYLVYVAGVTVFVLAPAVGAGDWRQAALRGAMFGFFAYATYDLTNQATLKAWSTRLSVIDMGWGTLATGLAAALTVLAAHRAARALGWA